MRTETTYLVARDGKQLFVRAWLPEGVELSADSVAGIEVLRS